MAQQAKSWFQSRMINLNGSVAAVTAIIAILDALKGQAFIAEYPRVVLSIVAATAIMNIYLRTVTTQPVK